MPNISQRFNVTKQWYINVCAEGHTVKNKRVIFNHGSEKIFTVSLLWGDIQPSNSVQSDNKRGALITNRKYLCRNVMFSQASVYSPRGWRLTSNASWGRSHGRVVPASGKVM